MYGRTGCSGAEDPCHGAVTDGREGGGLHKFSGFHWAVRLTNFCGVLQG